MQLSPISARSLVCTEQPENIQTISFENPSSEKEDSSVLPEQPFLISCLEERLFKKLYDKGVLCLTGEASPFFEFPSLPVLEGNQLKKLHSELKKKIRLHDQIKGWTTQKKLWELLDIQKNVRGVERVHLVGGRAMEILPYSWHLKAAKALNIFDQKELAELEEALRSYPHVPRDSDIRFYSSTCNQYDFEYFLQTTLHFLTDALSVVKKQPVHNLRRTSLDNCFYCPVDNNEYSIISFGDRCKSRMEIMLIHRLERTFLFLNHAIEIPIDKLIDELRDKKNGTPTVKEPLVIQPGCFSMHQKTGVLSREKKSLEWGALISFWLKMLQTKNASTINKMGWTRTLINELEGQTIRDERLAKDLYQKMIQTIINDDKIPDIAKFLSKSLKDHLGDEFHLSVGGAFQACIRLKNQFQDEELRRLYREILALHIPSIKTETAPLFLSQLHQLMINPKIPLSFIFDLVQLKGIFGIFGISEKAEHFSLKHHLGNTVIEIRLLEHHFCCIHVCFEPLVCLKNLLQHVHLFQDSAVAILIKQFLSNKDIPIADPSIGTDLISIKTPFNEWESLAFEYTLHRTPQIQQMGWILLQFIAQICPSDKNLKALLFYGVGISGNEKQEQTLQIISILDFAIQNKSDTFEYLRGAALSFRRYLNVLNLESLSFNSREERQLHYLMTWIKELSASKDLFCLECVEKAIKTFNHFALNIPTSLFQLVDVFGTNGQFRLAFKMMKQMQLKKNRMSELELKTLIALIQASEKMGVDHIKAFGNLSLNLIKQWDTEKYSDTKEFELIIPFLKKMWQDPHYSQIGFQIFLLLIEKEILNGDELEGDEWIEACHAALKHPICGLRFAFSIWKKGLSIWKEKTDTTQLVEFCIEILETFNREKIGYSSRNVQEIFEELLNLIAQFKEEKYAYYVSINHRIQLLVSQINYTPSLNNRSEKEFLVQLQIGEMNAAIDQKKEEAALKIFKSILRSDLKEIDSSIYPQVTLLLERFIEEIPFIHYRELIDIFKMENAKHIFSTSREKYFILLSKVIEKIGQVNTDPYVDAHSLRLILTIVETKQHFINCPSTILTIWTRCVTANRSFIHTFSPFTLVNLFIAAGLPHEMAHLILFLNKKSLLKREGCQSILGIWQCLETFSRSLDVKDIQLCQQVFMVLLKIENIEKVNSTTFNLIKRFISYDGTCSPKLLDSLGALKIDAAEAEELIDMCKNKEPTVQFHLLKALSKSALPTASISSHWIEILEKLEDKNVEFHLKRMIKFYALRYGNDEFQFTSVEEDLLLEVLHDHPSAEELESCLAFIKRYEIGSSLLWQTLFFAQRKIVDTDFSLLTHLFDVLIALQGKQKDEHLTWVFFLETSLKLPINDWLASMQMLPNTLPVLGNLEPHNKEILYKKILKKGVEALPEDSFNDRLYSELIRLREKMGGFKPHILTPIDLQFSEWIIDFGNEKHIAIVVDELFDNIKKEFIKEFKEQYLLVIMKRLCSRLLKDIHTKEKSDLKRIEKSLVDLFIYSLDSKIYETEELKSIFSRMASYLSLPLFIDLIFQVGEKQERFFHELETQTIETIINQLVKVNTPQSYEIAFKILLFNENLFKLKNTVLLGLIRQSVINATDMQKQLLINIFCEHYPHISMDGKLKKDLELAVISCLASIPQKLENWYLYSSLKIKIINCLFPSIQENKWIQTVDNILNLDLHFIFFGKHPSIPVLASSNPLDSEKKTSSSKKNKSVIPTKKNEEIDRFNRFILNLIEKQIDFFSEENRFTNTNPVIILSLTQWSFLQMSDMLLRTGMDEGQVKEGLYQTMAKLIHRLLFDFNFLDFEQERIQSTIYTKFADVYYPIFQDINNMLHVQRYLYLNIGKWDNTIFLESNMEKFIDQKVIIGIVETLLSKRKTTSFIKTIKLLIEGYQFIPYTVQTIKPIYKIIMREIKYYINETIDNMSLIEAFRLSISLYLTNILNRAMKSKKDNQKEHDTLMNETLSWSVNLLEEFFHLTIEIYSKPENLGKKIQCVKMSSIGNNIQLLDDSSQILESPLREYLLYVLKYTSKDLVLSRFPAVYKKLLTLALNC